MDIEKDLNLKGIKPLIRRRGKMFLITFSSILLLTLVIALILPPAYISESKILIEAQQIPPDYDRYSVTQYVEERLSAISQQTLSRKKLLDIINKFDLYPETHKNNSTEAALEQMRDSIHIKTISSGEFGKKSRFSAYQTKETTVAFTLSYEGRDPATVQVVTNVLASLFLEENLKKRSEQTSGTVEFFKKQLDELKKQMDDYDAKLTALKSTHLGELPEQSLANLQTLERLRMDLDQINTQLRTVQQRKGYLLGQLASVSPDERLDSLRNELTTLQTTLTDQHPDIKRLEREIRELEKPSTNANKSVGAQGLSGRKKVVNPAYINIKAQIETATLEIRSLQQQSSQIRDQINTYQNKVYQAPLVEGDYKILLNDYENTKSKYNETMNKMMQARAAQDMEHSQQGERFTIIEPAVFPERPFKPDRLKIILTGLFFSLIASIVLVTIQESMDQSIKTTNELKTLVKVPVLSIIPYMEDGGTKKLTLRQKIAGLSGR